MKALITKDTVRFNGQVPTAVQETLGLTGGFDYLNMSKEVSLQQIRKVLDSYFILEVRNEKDLKKEGEFTLTSNSDAKANLKALIVTLRELLFVLRIEDLLNAGFTVKLLAQMIEDYKKSNV